MLTAEQIEALRDRAGQLSESVIEYLIRDIAQRIARAGQLTATASYEIWRAQQLGISQREIKKQLRKLLKVSHRELRQLLTQAAEVGYNFDITNLPQIQAIPFAKNEGLQKIVSAAVDLAQKDFTNLTQSLGMVDPHGNALPMQDAYRSAMDFAYKQVVTGAADYNTAIRQATKNLAEQGLLAIDYESGVHTSLEAAVRRCVMGGLGLMQERISQMNHDEMGANGWEISAHSASAPDHEPIQGKQYSDAEYETLNNSLKRRIGTLNCGHAAFPIILGVSIPVYSPEELEEMRRKNAEGVTYQGRHYSMYEATQKQRQLERTIRKQRRRILVDDAAGDAEKLQTDQIRLVRLEDEYQRFSKAAGLRTQSARLETTGFGPGRARAAKKAGSLDFAPSSGAVAATATKTNAKKKSVPKDVTKEYLDSATPGQGTITRENGYKVGGHQNEIKTAQWLHDTFGGDIVLLKENNGRGVLSPDYIWNGKLWDLKNPSSISAADKRFEHGIKQILSNPGGVIIDMGSGDGLDTEKLEQQLTSRFNRSDIKNLDLILMVEGELKKVLRYKK